MEENEAAQPSTETEEQPSVEPQEFEDPDKELDELLEDAFTRGQSDVILNAKLGLANTLLEGVLDAVTSGALKANVGDIIDPAAAVEMGDFVNAYVATLLGGMPLEEESTPEEPEAAPEEAP